MLATVAVAELNTGLTPAEVGPCSRMSARDNLALEAAWAPLRLWAYECLWGGKSG